MDVDWIYAVVLLLLGILHVKAGLLQTQDDILLRLARTFLGLSALFAFLAIVLSSGEFAPWGVPTVICFFFAIVSGLGWEFKKWADPKL